MIGAKVDVLAVIDARSAQLGQLGHDIGMAQLRDVKAAVADLIEALRMSDEWIREATNFGGCNLQCGKTLYRNSQALKAAGVSL